MKPEAARALVVDLDGTLTPGDLLWEGCLGALTKAPAMIFMLLIQLLRGRLALKRRVLPYSLEAIPTLPWRPEVLAEIQAARAGGRRVYLATASLQEAAEAVGAATGLFDGCWGSRENLNLKGQAKADFLIGRFGAKNFDYIGDSRDDEPVFQAAAAGALITGRHGARRLAAVRRLNPEIRPLPAAAPGLKDFGRALRVHQWAKNILAAVPLFMAHAFNLDALLATALAAAGFCGAASAAYILNDLLDLRADRRHGARSRRPFASGALPLTAAPPLFAGALTAAVICARLSPGDYAAVLALYFVLTCAYSLFIKKILMADVVCLAGLYFIRVQGGAAALGLSVSNWLAAFCLFLFLGLALLKRVGEITGGAPLGGGGRPRRTLAGPIGRRTRPFCKPSPRPASWGPPSC